MPAPGFASVDDMISQAKKELAAEGRPEPKYLPDVQAQTLDLIRKYGWYYTGQGSDHITDRDREAAKFVKECYEAGGVTW